MDNEKICKADIHADNSCIINSNPGVQILIFIAGFTIICRWHDNGCPATGGKKWQHKITEFRWRLSTCYRRAQDMSMEGKKEDALRYLKMAVFIAPRFCKAYNSMGNFLDELGQYEDAIRKYDKVLDIDPLHAEARFKRNLVIEKLKQREAMKWDTGKQKVLEKEPDDHRTGICSGITQNGEFPFMLMRIGLNC